MESSELDGNACFSPCPACAFHVAVRFFDGGRQPLTTLAWPASKAEARALERLPLCFVRCASCGHVYNRAFDYNKVPYSVKPNLMFNTGEGWREYLEALRHRILRFIPEDGTVVEIGCGSGHFLQAIQRVLPMCRYIGFDPHASAPPNPEIEYRNHLFEAHRHLSELRPDLLICRHVLEHLPNPLGFLQSIAFAVSCLECETRFLFEVPCVDRVFASGRTADFFYEHHSHFTTQSLRVMLERSGAEVELLRKGYNDEVLFGCGYYAVQPDQVAVLKSSQSFQRMSEEHHRTFRADLDHLLASGKQVAIWGGTGKAASLLNGHRMTAEQFPVVVDSDPDKEGTFVPGTAQRILNANHLKEHPVEIIVIATQWRASDIVQEIHRAGIAYDTILLEHRGRLVDYFSNGHPYQRNSPAAEPPGHSKLRPAS